MSVFPSSPLRYSLLQEVGNEYLEGVLSFLILIMMGMHI
jgi:hypothetical protein